MSTVNLTSYYVFGSPRYNAATTYPTIVIPEDYTYYTGLNGTYDKYFPLYRLDESSEPLIEIVNSKGTSSALKGDLAMKLSSYNAKSATFGAIKGSQERPFNSNLEKKIISYSYWAHTRLNSAWCVIQNKQDATDIQDIKYVPQLLVRVLGNNAVLSQIHAIKLDTLKADSVWKTTDFPVGMIISYKDNVWKCKKQTKTNPPDKKLKEGQQNEFWEFMNLADNVFNADLFAITEDGSTGYMFEITDKKRKFNPIISNKNNDLVSWNLAYYHGN
jgi:hypothetical protein